MTTKQISEAVGRTERCVQGWAKRTGEKISSIGEKISSVQKLGIPADYDLDETIAIIEMGMGKNAAFVFRQNAALASSIPAKVSSPDSRLDRLESMVEKLLTVVVSFVQPQIEAKQKTVQAPPLDPRGEIRRIIAKAARSQGNYRETWNELYQQSYYRLHVNLKERADNRGIDTLDYAEQEGYLPALLAIAKAVFGVAA